ncbi:hypothetical protein OPV22_017528 [Ensete ventricosum]|uniref:Uncharacterized protein n=1 Tax=Ensete ventricosum TaxID=4639 RepID=A0AAV8R2D3_ENSVE|nr:hypothetical protein OPV22_017528 [Ensete ventricosum]
MGSFSKWMGWDDSRSVSRQEGSVVLRPHRVTAISHAMGACQPIMSLSSPAFCDALHTVHRRYIRSSRSNDQSRPSFRPTPFFPISEP